MDSLKVALKSVYVTETKQQVHNSGPTCCSNLLFAQGSKSEKKLPKTEGGFNLEALKRLV